MRAIWWIKRDFRLDDNLALDTALRECAQVVPVFFLEPRLYLGIDASAFHLRAQLSALLDLQHSLRERGAELLVIHADLPDGLASLKRELNFSHIFSHQETGAGLSYRRDQSVAAWCSTAQVTWQELPQSGVIRGLGRRDRRQKVIAERLFDSEPINAPRFIPQPDLSLLKARLPELFVIPELDKLAPALLDSAIHWPAVQVVNERRALRTLNSFLSQRGLGYRGGISSPNKAFFYGSRLSPHIAWGTISLRRIFACLHQRLSELDRLLIAQPENKTLRRWHDSLVAFSCRLFWRDHFVQRLESASFMEFHPLNPAYEALEYGAEPGLLGAWLQGKTGFPLIDACMRCLQATGFLNFRMRAMVVNFACFGLHIHWRDLQYPLARLFTDYEPGIHFSQVQMQAAIVGINTIRVYNPLKQLLDQDPDCQFVKHWIPELRSYSAEQIACHETMPLPGYTPVLVNAEHNIRLMKARISAIRKSHEGRARAAEVLANHGSRRSNRKSGSKSRINNKSPGSPEQTELF